MDFTKPDLPKIGAVVSATNGNNNKPITSISYHESGKRLFVVSPDDSRLHIIDCLNGKSEQPSLKCEREQIHLVTATHHEDNVLFAGTPTQLPIGQRNAICYWSLYDNKILRKFRGHTDKVTSISVCPADDTFLTSSHDRTVRLWNIGHAGCLAEMKLPLEETDNTNNVPPLSGFDSTGLVFAITAPMKHRLGHYVHLYDARNYTVGAFAELKVHSTDLEKFVSSQNIPTEVIQSSWKSIQFNVSGDQILVGTEHGMSIVLDGFDGTIQKVLINPHSLTTSSSSSTSSSEQQQQHYWPSVACVTPDDKTILQGNEDGSITCLSVSSGEIIQTLSEKHTGPIHCMASNPKYAQFASCCSQTALWTW